MAWSEENQQKPGVEMFTVEELVRLGNEVLQTLSGVRNLRPIPGCCTQGCCDEAVLEMLGRPPDSGG
jgi:hypothetical protein